MSAHTKILLVDDDEDDQFFFMDALKEVYPSVQCEIANNGLEAIGQLKSVSPLPSIIFLDLNMPLMNGYECLAGLKKDERLRNIPIVIYTTSTNNAELERIGRLGAKAILSKPSDFDILKMQLGEIMEMQF